MSAPERAAPVEGARVVGLGQPAAGDDGVGLAVLERLRSSGLAPCIELRTAAEASALLSLLQTPRRVVVVDAVVGAPVGEVLELSPEELSAAGLAGVSSHGLGIGQAIALARTLDPDEISPDIRVVAVGIARPQRYRLGFSAEVAAAIPRATERVLSLVGA